MMNYENIGKSVLVSYDKNGIQNYLTRKGENLDRIASKTNFVETYFEEDDLILVMIDNRDGKNDMRLICFQDFYINTDSLIDVENTFAEMSEDKSIVDVYKLAAHKLAHLITMIPTFQEYYYRHNLAYPSKAFTPATLHVTFEKAA
ncbi:hypothetical protein LAG90_13280 [Marinilongibacter aquaticus]|uniref:hypothetical protein n=1 Tax=Marinilongibacter aquaticus TaxID=2975157 RepID=UPI0021BD268B|nr:hypothetical protein [Marinilongibacter aquaticus]UBM57780.1 hypothetical protein LAG90_13280 [Marinilongibacter aquaticus]